MANELDQFIEELKCQAEALRIDLKTPFMRELFTGLAGVSDAMRKRYSASQDALETTIACVKSIPDTCQRKFPYHGPITKPCRRCLAIVAYEKATHPKGESATEVHLKTSVLV